MNDYGQSIHFFSSFQLLQYNRACSDSYLRCIALYNLIIGGEPVARKWKPVTSYKNITIAVSIKSLSPSLSCLLVRVDQFTRIWKNLRFRSHHLINLIHHSYFFFWQITTYIIIHLYLICKHNIWIVNRRRPPHRDCDIALLCIAYKIPFSFGSMFCSGFTQKRVTHFIKY